MGCVRRCLRARPTADLQRRGEEAGSGSTDGEVHERDELPRENWTGCVRRNLPSSLANILMDSLSPCHTDYKKKNLTHPSTLHTHTHKALAGAERPMPVQAPNERQLMGTW